MRGPSPPVARVPPPDDRRAANKLARQLDAERKNPFGQRRGLFSADLFPELGRLTRQVANAQAMHSCVTVAVAATRYRLAHNQYPPTAQALVPEFLDTVPLDPYTGQVLRYKKNEDGSVAIYSVGEDLADNGGDFEYKKNVGYRDMGLKLRPAP